MQRMNTIEQKECGSLTVETILALPLCLMVLVIWMTYFPLLRLQLQLQSALVQIVQMQAVYTGAQQTEASWLGAEGELLALCWKEQVELDQIPMGVAGMHLRFISEGETVLCGTLTYQFQLPFLSGSLGRLPCVQQCRCRIWNGTAAPEHAAQGDLVYYTEYGAVYHTYLDCTYLRLSIHPVSKQQLGMARNEAGAKYRQCEICGEEPVKTQYYITEQGDRYHTRLTCPGLSRYINTADRETLQEQGMGECSRCRKREAGS